MRVVKDGVKIHLGKNEGERLVERMKEIVEFELPSVSNFTIFADPDVKAPFPSRISVFFF